MHLALAQLFVIFFVFISEINRKKKMTVVCPSTTRPVLNDFDWVENAGILSSFIPVEKCPSVMTLDCARRFKSVKNGNRALSLKVLRDSKIPLQRTQTTKNKTSNY